MKRGPSVLFFSSKISCQLQHLQNKIYATHKETTNTKKFQKPSKSKSTIIPTLNQKKAKPHTRFIYPPCYICTCYKTVYSGSASFVTTFYSLSKISDTAVSTSSELSSVSSFFWKRSIKSGTISSTLVIVS